MFAIKNSAREFKFKGTDEKLISSSASSVTGIGQEIPCFDVAEVVLPRHPSGLSKCACPADFPGAFGPHVPSHFLWHYLISSTIFSVYNNFRISSLRDFPLIVNPNTDLTNVIRAISVLF
jgi:hypothetical protein